MSAAVLLALLRTIPDDTDVGVALPPVLVSAGFCEGAPVVAAAGWEGGAGLMLIAGGLLGSVGFGAMAALSTVGVAALEAGEDDRVCDDSVVADELDAVLAAASLASRRARI